MEVALEILREQVEPEIRAALPPDAAITYSGTAEALNEALGNLASSFVLAIIILYLLISALFRSFRDSILVLMTIPMATVGGILALSPGWGRYRSGHGYADHDRLRDSAGPGRQQCDSAGLSRA